MLVILKNWYNKWFIILGRINKLKNMNSSFVGISILLKSRTSERCLINILMNMSSQSLRGYVRLANIYDGNSNKKNQT